ncbi:MAG: very short patch repair endonuclease [Succinivibrionaceae bacterium]|nr:very short patch repair endonuclease [Succinivibrionaceae bacterium]
MTPEQRSHIMSCIHSNDTKPEVLVRSYLFRLGFRFRKHDRRLPGKPDVVLPRYRTVIFINGCFWHAHEGCANYRLPRTNTEWWRQKLARNVARDQSHREELTRQGWHVITIWECELTRARRAETLAGLARRIVAGGNAPPPRGLAQE